LPQVVLRFISPPFGLWDGRDGDDRPVRGSAGLTAGRRDGRSALEDRLRRCAHGATLAEAAEEPLKAS
jgi:hypothetical protein